jgi:hypothetical protein
MVWLPGVMEAGQHPCGAEGPELGLEKKGEPDIHPGHFWLQDVTAGRTRGSYWAGFDPQAWAVEM